jgi:molybdate transport repressor ModE-like protein
MQVASLPWDEFRLLLAVHRSGSFFGASRELGVSTSTVARRIDALEAIVGRVLVRRTSRGAQLVPEAQPLVAAAEMFERSLAVVSRDDLSPYAGTVRLSAPEGFGPAMATAAARFQRLHPETQVELGIESRFVDLTAREADVAVRGGRSSSTVLIEKPLGEVRAALYASAEYLARHLPSRALKSGDYAAQSFVSFESTRNSRASWLEQRGATRFSFRSDSFEARVRAAEEGAGLVELAVGDAVNHPKLIRIATDPLPSLTFYLTMHRELRRMPRVRGLALAVEEVCREYLAAQADAEARQSALRRHEP